MITKEKQKKKIPIFIPVKKSNVMVYMHSPLTFVLYCFSGLGFNFTLVERFCLLNTVCAMLNANGTTFIASVAVGQTSVTSTLSCCNTNGCNKNNLDGKIHFLCI